MPVRALKSRSRRRTSGRKPGVAAQRRRTAVARAGAPAGFIPPMKALSVEEVPPGEWRLEIKLDGYRAIAVINEGDVELWSRNRKPLTAAYPELVAALERIRCTNAVLDGEITALDPAGRPRFQLLQQRGMSARPAPVVFYVFDLLHRDGHSLLERPIEERQRELAELLDPVGAGVIRISPVFDQPAGTLLEAARDQGLEGIIAKAAGSLYEADRRSGAWLKCKVHGEQEFVIGGYTPPKNSRSHFGAILVGYHEDGEFRYAGKVGSGFDQARLAQLHREFDRRRAGTSPFANLPMARKSRFGAGMNRAAMREVTWVKPELVCQVRFTEWTDDGMLRHPVFLGLRSDKAPREVVREAPPAATKK
jgi:bifunctional non-homologous end joining protein LigD